MSKKAKNSTHKGTGNYYKAGKAKTLLDNAIEEHTPVKA